MSSRYMIYDLRTRQTVMTEPLRTKPLARRARRELAKYTKEPTRFIVIPGPEHKKWISPSSRSGR